MTGGEWTIAAKFWNTGKSVVTDLTDSRKPNPLPAVRKPENQAEFHSACSGVKLKRGEQSKEEWGTSIFEKLDSQTPSLTLNDCPFLWTGRHQASSKNI